MSRARRVVIIAGEESGDVHAAKLIRQLKARYPDCIISGIGGKHMQEAGADLIADLARFGVTGFTEVIRHFKTIRRAYNDIKLHLSQEKPDLLILVDYPGFNLRLAKFAKQVLNLKILYYISPQIWAWKPSRINTIKQCIDQMAVILPFEKSIYQQAEVPVNFVGHPLIEKIQPYMNYRHHRNTLGLPPNATLIALLPGSRKNEIEKHLPILRDTAQLIFKQQSQTHFVIPVADTINPAVIQSYFSDCQLPITFVKGKAIECMAVADFVYVASGTASLECALLNKPMCIIYKSSFITYHIAMKFLNVRFLGLCNLLSNTMLVPEFLQYDCNAKELSRYFFDFINNPEQPQKLINKLAELKQSLSSLSSDCSLLDLVIDELPEKSAVF